MRDPSLMKGQVLTSRRVIISVGHLDLEAQQLIEYETDVRRILTRITVSNADPTLPCISNAARKPLASVRKCDILTALGIERYLFGRRLRRCLDVGELPRKRTSYANTGKN